MKCQQDSGLSTAREGVCRALGLGVASGFLALAATFAPGGFAGTLDGTSCAWQAGFHTPGMDRRVYSMTVFDDGTGPALYAAGAFTIAGRTAADHIAEWDGTQWSPLSPGGFDDSVQAMAVYDDGSGPALYAGGWFLNAGGVHAPRIARWDGREWSPLVGPAGYSVGGLVHCLAVYDDDSGPALYVGGNFLRADGDVVSGIARWDGEKWSALHGPFEPGVGGGSIEVNALVVFDDGSGPALYAGGSFATAGGLTANNIARWDGNAWSALAGPSGTGVVGIIHTLAVFNDGSGAVLVAGGSLTHAGGVEVHAVATWDGAAWGPPEDASSASLNGAVLTLKVHDDGSGSALFAGGEFTAAGPTAMKHIARWDGRTWSAVGVPGQAGRYDRVYALEVYDEGSGPALFAGGFFETVGAVRANHIARWYDGAWTAVCEEPYGGLDKMVLALDAFDDGRGPALYAGGHFTIAGGDRVDHIARWDGTIWSALTGDSGFGVSDWVSALKVFDDGAGAKLYVGGFFESAGGVPAQNIATWDGDSWSALTDASGAVTGPDSSISSFEVFDHGTGPALYAAGQFVHAGGVRVDHIGRWDGDTWCGLEGPSGTGLDLGYEGSVDALAVFDDGSGPALYVAGRFVYAGGVRVNHIARWDGDTWSGLHGPTGTGVDDGDENSGVRALAVFDDGTGPALYMGGSFEKAGGIPTGSICKWDGNGFSEIRDASGEVIDPVSVSAFEVHDDGSKPTLFMSGPPVSRWNGYELTVLEGPFPQNVTGTIHSLSIFNDGSGDTLFAGGGFNVIGGIPSSRIAAWRCVPPPPRGSSRRVTP